MEDSSRTWFEKLENQLRSVAENTVALSTKMDMILSGHKDHDNRLRALEEYKHRQEGINVNSDRKRNQILVVVIAIEVILFGIGFFITHAKKIF